MGWGGRSSRGKGGRGKGGGQWKPRDAAWAGGAGEWDGYDDWEEEEEWAQETWGKEEERWGQKSSWAAENWGQSSVVWNKEAATLAVSGEPKSLAAQWRFSCRVLRRCAPEERVYDPRRQLRVGDHVFMQSSWDFSEQHGLVVSIGEEGHGRRGGNTREESWVIFFQSSQVHSSTLSQFAKGGTLYRVTYPVWACRCYIPAASTTKPYIEDERLLNAEADEIVVKQANIAYRNGAYSSKWSQATDLEFCLQTKTGQQLAWEVHGRSALTSLSLAPIGCLFRGDHSPTHVFSRDSARAAPSPTSAAPPPGYASTPAEWLGGNQPRSRQGPPETGRKMMTVQELEAQQSPPSKGYSGQNWNNNWQQQYPQGANQGAGRSLSAEAQVFVPGHAGASPSDWGGIYQ